MSASILLVNEIGINPPEIRFDAISNLRIAENIEKTRGLTK